MRAARFVPVLVPCEANNSITEIFLGDNNIGDGGAIALAESLKATLLTCFRLVRAMLSVWPAGP